MVLKVTTKTYNTYVKGLITEAGPLTFPENASLDEDNCILDLKGNRRRRLGIDYEPNYSLSTATFTNAQIGATLAVTADTWRNVGKDANTTFLVLQIGATLYFYDLSVEVTSDAVKSFTVNLDTYKASGVATAAGTEVHLSSGKGALFVVSSDIDPIYITYDSTGDTITTTTITIQVRDFEGIDDTLDIDEQPATLANPHKYNLSNQGWDQGGPAFPATKAYASYFTTAALYPSNVQQNVSSKDFSTAADWADFIKETNYGNTPAPKGHYILKAFYKDRSTVSGITGISVVSEAKRPEASAFFSGRIWFGAVSGGLYFSQVLREDFSNVGYCYQDADPTSTEDSALVQTDGGFVPIPDATNIIGLFPYNSGLLVFGGNGVWFVNGTDGGFKATDFSIDQVSKDVGALNQTSIVSVEGTPIWMSANGIYTVTTQQVSGKPQITSLTDSTIQSYYQEIPSDSKLNAKGVYDISTKKIMFLFKSSDDDSYNKYTYDSILNFDTRLGSFYPWSIKRLTTDTPYITGAYVTPTNLTLDTIADVLDSSLDNVIDSSSNQVQADITSPITGTTRVKFVVYVPNGSSSKFTFGLFNNANFLDWELSNSVGKSYSSYLITGYELQGDIMRFKQAPYIYCYFNRTETGFSGDDTNGYTLTNPSSCFMQVRFDWADNANSNKWGASQQVYRIKRDYRPTSLLDYDNGFPVVVTKNKVLGRGRSIHIKFFSEEGKDFNLLGWAAFFTGGDNI